MSNSFELELEQQEEEYRQLKEWQRNLDAELKRLDAKIATPRAEITVIIAIDRERNEKKRALEEMIASIAGQPPAKQHKSDPTNLELDLYTEVEHHQSWQPTVSSP